MIVGRADMQLGGTSFSLIEDNYFSNGYQLHQTTADRFSVDDGLSSSISFKFSNVQTILGLMLVYTFSRLTP
jgi:hypothetical protein